MWGLTSNKLKENVKCDVLCIDRNICTMEWPDLTNGHKIVTIGLILKH